MDFKQQWQKLNDDLVGKTDYFLLTVTGYALYRAITSLSEKYFSGRLLDAGAGRLAWRWFLKPLVKEYISCDKYQMHPELSCLGDLIALPFPADNFDTVFCSQVLEHIPEYEQAIKEMVRVLKPGGHLIISVPHLSYLHGVPDDYCRFTKYMLKHILEKYNMEVIEIIPTAGLISFLFTIPSAVVLSFLYRSIIFRIVFKLNLLCIRFIYVVDKLFDKDKIYTLDYVVVARKK